jgi:hypothetical protein
MRGHEYTVSIDTSAKLTRMLAEMAVKMVLQANFRNTEVAQSGAIPWKGEQLYFKIKEVKTIP